MACITDSRRYGNTGVRSSLCGKEVKITNEANGKTVTVVIADACPTCNDHNSFDLSVAAFERLASLGVGLLHSKILLKPLSTDTNSWP
jgi:rare lipoprotein A (peptidoglycan hydrolase)